MVGLAGQALSTGSYTTCRVCSALLYVQHQTERKQIIDCAVFRLRSVSFPKFHSAFIIILLPRRGSGEEKCGVCVCAVHIPAYINLKVLLHATTSWSRDRTAAFCLQKQGGAPENRLLTRKKI